MTIRAIAMQRCARPILDACAGVNRISQRRQGFRIRCRPGKHVNCIECFDLVCGAAGKRVSQFTVKLGNFRSESEPCGLGVAIHALIFAAVSGFAAVGALFGQNDTSVQSPLSSDTAAPVPPLGALSETGRAARDEDDPATPTILD